MSSLRRAGSIGINTIIWQTEVNRVSTRNNAITKRLNPTVNRSNFTVLRRMLDHVESINKLSQRYKSVVSEDVRRMRSVSTRMEQNQKDLSAIFRRV